MSTEFKTSVVKQFENDTDFTVSMETTYQTMIITWSESIDQLNSIFDIRQKWGVSTLKEWIDSYESTRFTQIGENTAVITSEYNMQFVMHWLQNNTNITKQQEG